MERQDQSHSPVRGCNRELAMRCPLCSGEMRRLFTHRQYWIRGCKLCYHRAAEIPVSADHVTCVYGDQYFTGGGAGYADYLSEGHLLTAHGRHYARVLARYMQPGEMLDVGAAAGFVLKGFVEAGWHGTGVEPNNTMAEYARTHLKLDVATGTFEDFPTQNQYDLISMIQVILHFVDPAAALRRASELARPSGFLLIETWDRESWTARAFGRHWHAYSPPSVLHWFSREGLSSLAARFGFHVVAQGRPAKRITSAHALSILRYRLAGTRPERLFARLARIVPDRLVIPYPAEDMFWVLFRKDPQASVI
jgi:SAM-dependent methyltransferase